MSVTRVPFGSILFARGSTSELEEFAQAVVADGRQTDRLFRAMLFQLARGMDVRGLTTVKDHTFYQWRRDDFELLIDRLWGEEALFECHLQHQLP